MDTRWAGAKADDIRTHARELAAIRTTGDRASILPDPTSAIEIEASLFARWQELFDDLH